MVRTRQQSLGLLRSTSPACSMYDKLFSLLPAKINMTTYLMPNGRVMRMSASINPSVKVAMAAHYSIIELPSSYKTVQFKELNR